jgi:hypothetical protein
MASTLSNSITGGDYVPAAAQPVVHDAPRAGARHELHEREHAEDARGDLGRPVGAAALADGHELVPQDRRDRQRARGDRQRDQRDVDRVVFHAPHIAFGIARAHDDVQQRIARAQVAQHRGQQVEAARAARAQPHAARDAGRMKGGGVDCVGQRRRHVRQLRHQVRARRRGAHAPADPLDQAHAKASFQLLDLHADRWLRHAEPFGRG